MVMFENGVGQAVHFAYEITEYASTPESQLAKIMRMAIKKNGELAYEQTASRTHFGGLTGQEIRAQAAFIRSAVDRLPPLQAAAIKARHEPRPLNKSPCVALLCAALPVYLDSAEAQKALVWQQYSPKGLSSRAIAKEYGLAPTTVIDRALKIKQAVAAHELVAYTSLESILSGQGIID